MKMKAQLAKKDECLADLQRSVEERQDMLQQSNVRIGELEDAQTHLENQVSRAQTHLENQV
jgi:molybdopterin-biosynthesis enzyme MoeA-like protein